MRSNWEKIRKNEMKVTTGNHYLAYVLDQESHEKIMNLYYDMSSKHPVVKCHHVTLARDIKEEDIPRLQALVDLNPKFVARFFLLTDEVDLFLVELDDFIRPTDRSRTHLTFSHREGAQANDSNRVLVGEIPVTGFHIVTTEFTGQFQLIPKKNQSKQNGEQQ